MWVLVMNDMRAANVENVQPVFRAEEKQQLIELLMRERVDNYRDGQWNKAFRQDGPLEWKNPPFNMEDALRDSGTEDDWANNARRHFNELCQEIPIAPVR